MPDTHAKEVHCDEECVNTMGFTAKFGMQECPECTKDCRTSVSWDKVEILRIHVCSGILGTILGH